MPTLNFRHKVNQRISQFTSDSLGDVLFEINWEINLHYISLTLVYILTSYLHNDNVKTSIHIHILMYELIIILKKTSN